MWAVWESHVKSFFHDVCVPSQHSFQNFRTNKSIYDVDLISQSPNKRVAKHHHHLDQQPNDSSIVVFNSHVAESDSLFLLSYYKID